MPRAQYTPQQKADALVLYAQHGAAETARRTGIPEGTLMSWAHRNGVQSLAAEQTRAAVEAAKAKWDERKLKMVHEIGSVAQMALAQAEAAVMDGKGRDAKDFATTMAILVDKAQLLSGAATQRTEVADRPAAEERLAELIDLDARRKSA